MKRPLILSSLLALSYISIPACTSTRWVDVHLRDALTREPVSDGRFDTYHTVWDGGINPFFKEGGGGGFSGGHENLQVLPWVDEHVTVTAQGYGKNCFDIFVNPSGKEGTIASDWTKAKLLTKDGREIEYQVTYPFVRPDGIPKSEPSPK